MKILAYFLNVITIVCLGLLPLSLLYTILGMDPYQFSYWYMTLNFFVKLAIAILFAVGQMSWILAWLMPRISSIDKFYTKKLNVTW